MGGVARVVSDEDLSSELHRRWGTRIDESVVERVQSVREHDRSLDRVVQLQHMSLEWDNLVRVTYKGQFAAAQKATSALRFDSTNVDRVRTPGTKSAQYSCFAIFETTNSIR